eukprot:CAMPEP_0198535078 /NCGR_PEP_ID=MMETSP1462-20131121/37992_1 /TAXON_ID=1333877 /ORGANISM="Brandtodinium nutriculum, Strain RCC3387" /LENGTH=47 /DNA_ID= /DNA_START= /DNA_END= /DNA_ORIENTATION=
MGMTTGTMTIAMGSASGHAEPYANPSVRGGDAILRRAGAARHAVLRR